MPKMPPDLPMLVPSQDAADRVQIQQTAFSHDVLGRYVCNDWDEVQAALDDGGYPFDAVVIGGGMFGAYCAAKLYWRSSQALRILVLDGGGFLLGEHIQNFPRRLGGSIGGPRYLRNREDGTQAHNAVWGIPWISNEGFPGLAYCLGGRSLFFGGWAPRPTTADLSSWPAEVRSYLEGGQGAPSAYERIEREIGVAEITDYMMGPFHDSVMQAFKTAAPAVATVTNVEEAPLAVQGSAPGPGLFPFAKFSSGPFLMEAVRADVERAMQSYGDIGRNLFVIPFAQVLRLNLSGNAVTALDVFVGGARRSFPIDPSCAVVLANGTIEATRLALESLGVGSTQFGAPRLGNLTGHLRSNITVRIRRGALGLGPAPANLETTALFVRGEFGGRRYHLQVTAGATGTADPEKNLWQQVPDIDLQDDMRANQDPDWVTITLRGIGQMEDDRSLPPNPARSWIDLSPETDDWQMRRAYVHLVTTPGDETLWRAMDDAAFDLAAAIARGPENIQYWNKNAPGWQNDRPQRPPTGRAFWQDALGTTHHEAGTLFMGDDPATSITDGDGKFHHLSNVYVAGPAIMPTMGSANPSLTALTLARRTAGAIIEAANPETLPGFTPLSLDPRDWRMVARPGTQPAMRRTPAMWETFGGYGLYWYTKEQFENFQLYLEWRVAKAGDNSGVYIRIPSPDIPNALNEADAKGHEIQIDEIGAPDGAAIHRTGAIYGLQGPSAFPSVPVGKWNAYLIEANGPRITVTLNGQPVNSFDSPRDRSGHLALQVHHMGSRVQFRALQVKKLP